MYLKKVEEKLQELAKKVEEANSFLPEIKDAIKWKEIK